MGDELFESRDIAAVEVYCAGRVLQIIDLDAAVSVGFELGLASCGETSQRVDIGPGGSLGRFAKGLGRIRHEDGDCLGACQCRDRCGCFP